MQRKCAAWHFCVLSVFGIWLNKGPVDKTSEEWGKWEEQTDEHSCFGSDRTDFISNNIDYEGHYVAKIFIDTIMVSGAISIIK